MIYFPYNNCQGINDDILDIFNQRFINLYFVILLKQKYNFHFNFDLIGTCRELIFKPTNVVYLPI